MGEDSSLGHYQATIDSLYSSHYRETPKARKKHKKNFQKNEIEQGEVIGEGDKGIFYYLYDYRMETSKAILTPSYTHPINMWAKMLGSNIDQTNRHMIQIRLDWALVELIVSHLVQMNQMM